MEYLPFLGGSSRWGTKGGTFHTPEGMVGGTPATPKDQRAGIPETIPGGGISPPVVHLEAERPRLLTSGRSTRGYSLVLNTSNTRAPYFFAVKVFFSAVPCICNNVLSLIHISEPTRLLSISYAVFCLKKK